jgi:Na+-translocating ferredoxin:NAD+ oxidoreductase RnfC subunit
MQSVGWNSGVKSDVITGAYLCCECGLCGALFQCPAGLSPNRINARFKKIFATSKISNPHQKNVSKVREDRDGRLVPVERLMQRLCLTQYNNLAILNPEVKNVNIVKIPLNEHIGKASEPIVKRNDNVKAGEMIAVIPDGAIGSNVHSSINGKVMEVNSEYIKLSVQ